MPTIIALDTSLSMQRPIPGRSEENTLTYHQLAQKGISQLLEYLSSLGKVEYVAFLTYNSSCEVRVDFTRDYEHIRQSMRKVEAGDKVCLLSLMKFIGGISNSTWGSQSFCQVVALTDCGLGFGSTSLRNFLHKHTGKDLEPEYHWLRSLQAFKWNFICLGVQSDNYFMGAINVYQQFLDYSGLNGKLYLPKVVRELVHENNENNGEMNIVSSNVSSSGKNNPVGHKNELGRTVTYEMMERLCEMSFKPYETILKCGSHFRLETAVLLWPPPTWYQETTSSLHSHQHHLTLAPKLEICGYVLMSDIGIPGSMGRHLITAKVERDKSQMTNSPGSSFNHRKNFDKTNSSGTSKGSSSVDKLRLGASSASTVASGTTTAATGGSAGINGATTSSPHENAVQNQWNLEHEKLEQDIRDFFAKHHHKDSDDAVIIIDDIDLTRSPVGGSNIGPHGGSGSSGSNTVPVSEQQKESLCVLLHNALRAENLAALVLLNENWYGFLYSCADSKKRCSLILNVLPPGSDAVPWMGDFQMLGFADSAMPSSEASSFPVKAEKRSYSQNCVVWINNASLQSDVQKVLRHAKKMPEKTSQFYKELNRIRRTALSIGFLSLLEALATLFEKEALHLTTNNTNPECILQLKHAAIELRRSNGRDAKMSIVPFHTGPSGTSSCHVYS